MDDNTGVDMSEEALERFFAYNRATSPSPAPRPATRSPFNNAMARMMEKRRRLARDAEEEAEAEAARKIQASGVNGYTAEETAGMDDTGFLNDTRGTEQMSEGNATNLWNNENRTATGILDGEPEQKKRKRLATDESNPVTNHTERDTNSNPPLQRYDRQPSESRSEAIARETERVAAPKTLIHRESKRRKQSPINEATTHPNQDNPPLRSKSSKKETTLERQRREKAKFQKPTAFGQSSFLSDEATKIEERNASRLEDTAGLFRAAYEHLDRMSVGLKEDEMAARKREEEVRRMLWRAERVRKEAEEWRVKGGEKVRERRRRLGELEGLRREELEGVEGWEEVLAPLSF